MALLRNPFPERGVGRIPFRHGAVAELHLEVAQLPELVAPFRVSMAIIISSFKFRCIETWLFLVLAVSIISNLVLALESSLARPLFGLPLVNLAHGEC